jgi:sacsin
LRNESHIGENSILRTTWTARTIEDEIIRPFLLAAHEFLLFTKLQAIKFRRRDAAGTISKEERISATRQDECIDGKCRSEILHISHSPPKAASGGQKWTVVSTYVRTEDFSDYSPEISEKYHLRSPIVAGIAAKLDPPDRTLSGKIFSTLPLPVLNALPVHITAPFISSSERRQIRFDGYDTLEPKYNQWLLESVIPPLYAFLLADLLRHHGHNKQWWPGTAEEGSAHKINQILVSAFYRIHLGETKYRVFLPKYAVHPLLPNEAVILNAGSPAVLKKVIKILKPPQLTSLPNRSRSSAIQNAKIGSVTPLFIKNQVLRYAGDLPSRLSFVELQEFLDFIRKNDSRDLIDLPLLPLADGTFTKFEDGSSCTEMYLIWKPRPASNPFFLQNHLVHPEVHATPLLDLGLNVTKLSVSRIQQLIHEILPQGDERSEMTPSEEERIVSFWSEYPLFQLDGNSLLHSVSSFPLVRTMQRGRYVSISRCRDQSSVILSSSEESKLWDCLTQLELTVVNRYSEQLPRAVRKILQPSSTVDGFSHFRFDHVLSALRPSIARRFERLNADDHRFIANWARSQIFCTSKDLLPDAKMLPIWSPIRNLNKPSLFLPATDITMLQHGVTSALVRPFINNILVTEFSTELIRLGLSPMSWSEFFNKLHFPHRILPHRDMQSYLRLLTTIVDRDPDIPWVLVPNCNNVMCQSDTLYARDPLFLAAFGSVSRHFVAEGVRNLETRLKAKFGLNCQSQLDLAMFIECASAFDDLDDLSGNRVQRADVIFQIYCQELPLRVREGSRPWESLNSLKFIPRINGRSRWNKDVSAYVRNRDLPDIVAPKDIIIPKYEAVAWTQRVLSAAEPNQRLLIANPGFGHPTAEEVVSSFNYFYGQNSVIDCFLPQSRYDTSIDWYIKYRPITLKIQPSCGIWKRHTLGLTNIQQMLVCT